MSREQLEAILAEYGLKVDGGHTGAGKFRDLYIGIGASRELLNTAMERLKREGMHCFISRVDNPEHPDYPKPFLEIPSFWDE